MEFVLAIVGALCAAGGVAFPILLRWYAARSRRQIEASQAQAVDERIGP